MRPSGHAYGTSALVLSLTAIMIALSLAGVARFQTMIDVFALRSSSWSWQDPLSYGRLFSHVLLHRSADHFFWNVMLLLLVGSVVEWRLGFKAILGLFVAGAAVGALTHILIFPTESRALIGASGAISALLGAAVIVAGDMGLRVRPPRTQRWFALTVRRLLLFWLVFQLVGLLRLFLPGASDVSVAYWAHIAGFAVGIVGVLALQRMGKHSTSEISDPAPVPTFAGAGD